MTNDNSRKIAAWYVLGESLETLSAIAFVLCIGLKLLEQNPPGWPEGRRWFIAVLLLLLGIAARLYGDVLESRAEADRESSQHEITERRLKTLEAVGVEKDILEVLSLRLGKPALSAKKLTTWLEARIGRERTQDRLAEILRYTRAVTETTRQRPGEAVKQPAEISGT